MYSPIYPRKPRPRRNRRRAAPPAPPVGLTVVSVTAEITGGGIEAAAFPVFNTTAENPLADPSGAAPGKWSLRLDNKRWTCVVIELNDFNSLYLGFGPHVAEVGPDQLSYTNAPSDIADTLGRQLAAFVFEL
jgi:hypothetical protein